MKRNATGKPNPGNRDAGNHGRLACAWLLCFLLAVSGNAFARGKTEQSLLRVAMDHIDSVLEGVEASTGSIANEFVEASRDSRPAAPGEDADWREHSLRKDNTVLLQTWPGPLEPTPSYQSDMPAILSYRGDDLSSRTIEQIHVLQNLVPVVRAAYHAFPFSWSYVTTADDLMLLYPFLTLAEAVNNDPPTQQTYYRRADFNNRKAGWTPPYLDLVGAGMMVTVSTPAYDGDTLLGVVSHDITLAQLSEKVLNAVTRDTGGTAWLVDDTGLVIGVSDPDLARELDTVNSAAGAAILHYRTSTWLEGSGKRQAKTSDSNWIDEVTEIVIDRVGDLEDNAVLHFERDGREVFAARSDVSGWCLVWMTQ